MNDDIYADSTILIVDDEASNVLVLERLLERHGYRAVTGVTDPLEALAICAKSPPDLLLLDLRMDELDGLEFLERLPTVTDQWVPAIILTADPSSESRRQALAAGARDFLTKPFDHI